MFCLLVWCVHLPENCSEQILGLIMLILFLILDFLFLEQQINA